MAKIEPGGDSLNGLEFLPDAARGSLTKNASSYVQGTDAQTHVASVTWMWSVQSLISRFGILKQKGYIGTQEGQAELIFAGKHPKGILDFTKILHTRPGGRIQVDANPIESEMTH